MTLLGGGGARGRVRELGADAHEEAERLGDVGHEQDDALADEERPGVFSQAHLGPQVS